VTIEIWIDSIKVIQQGWRLTEATNPGWKFVNDGTEDQPVWVLRSLGSRRSAREEGRMQ
jgi:hypothetical protein